MKKKNKKKSKDKKNIKKKKNKSIVFQKSKKHFWFSKHPNTNLSRNCKDKDKSSTVR